MDREVLGPFFLLRYRRESMEGKIDPLGLYRIGYGERRDRILRVLKKFGYKEGNFTLASGKKSNHYIDCKQAILRRGLLVAVGLEMFAKILDMRMAPRPVTVAGEGMGGMPLAAIVSMSSITAGAGYWLNPILIRGKAKDHGTKNLLEYSADEVEKGAITVLVEDVITTGGSSFRAIRLLRESGFKVPAVIALVDRQEGGKENLEREGLRVESMFTLDNLRGVMPWGTEEP